MSYVVFTASGELPIEADECDRDGGFISFYTHEITKIVEERSEARGFWPFRSAAIVRREQPLKRRTWVMDIREDYVNILIPAPPASAIEAGTVETEGLDAKHESATGEAGDAQ